MSTSLLPAVHADAPTGQLTLAQRWRLTTALMLSQARAAVSQGRGTRLDAELVRTSLLNSLELPRGPMADLAHAHAHSGQPAWLTQHGLRCHAWGQALGAVGGLRFDGEVLFAAALLHDTGLTDLAAVPADHCFAIRGARHARQLLAPVAQAQRVEAVAEAIARHLDFQVGVGDGVEAHLLQGGAMVDVVGRGWHRLPAAWRQEVLQRHPRLNLKRELCNCMQRVSQQAPGTRASLYVRRFGFLDLIRSAPFEE